VRVTKNLPRAGLIVLITTVDPCGIRCD